ncbi:MAG: TonB-dependent receptor [Bacteroidales bacterium]
MKKSILILILLAVFSALFSQKPLVIKGMISDSLTGEPLIGASISLDEKKGTISDAGGQYILLTEGEVISVICRYLGYQPYRKTLYAGSRDTIILSVRMVRSVILLDELVVSASRYEQKLSEVLVSMDIIKPERISNNSISSLDNIIAQTPGVEILDGQPGIRGGAGYSYGAGSRVLVLMDDLPILTGDAGDVKWDYLPVENIAQIEIIKGASSVLYGSSALNGVFNIRTAYPASEPKTSLSTFLGVYLDPRRSETVWWDKQRIWSGANFAHARKIGQLDLVVGGNIYKDQGYRENEHQQRGRLNLKLNYRSRKIKGLSYGVNMNSMLVEKIDFLMWQDADSGALRQNPEAISALNGSRINVDPYIIYYGNNGARHSLKTRFFHVKNNFPEATDKNNRSNLMFGEYQYYRKFGDKFDFTGGLSATWSETVAELYGNHNSFNNAIFAQLDAKPLKKLNLSLGVRFERYKLDRQVEYSNPVVRAGLNYQVLEYTYLRASFGQGYRFPSVAEKFTATSVGAMNIFPNPDLQSERGWSAELGVKQGVRLGEWNGYIDLAAFWTQYHDMIEFNFGVYKPDSIDEATLEHVGFKALNVGNARITGFETTLVGAGKLYILPLTIMAGYTYINPIDLNVGVAGDTTENQYLKYRFKHSVKGDIEISPGRFTLGYTIIYNSRMENIDEVFLSPIIGELILPGFPDYWAEQNNGYTIMNARVLYDVADFMNVGLILRNISNKEYMGRPGDIRPPRNFTFQLTFRF